MAKILSQEEIDALLTTVSTGDDDGTGAEYDDEKMRSIVTYDFKHPNRVSKDQIRTLENLHDNFAGHFGSMLSTVLRTIVDVDLVSVDQITYSEFIMSLVSPSCTYTFSAEPLDGVSLIDFNPTLSFSIIDRMFGGHGKTLEAERDLTGIERSVMSRLVLRFFEELKKSWYHLVQIDIEKKSFESNPQFIQIVPPGETVVVISFQVRLFQTTGLLTICYPYVSLEPIVGKLSAQNWIDATKRKITEGDRQTNIDNLKEIEVTLAAELLDTRLKMREFLALKVGDVIPSDKKISDYIQVTVGGRSKMTAQPGLSGKKRAVQIVEIEENLLKELAND